MEACVRFGWMALSEDARRAAVQLAASDAPVDWELLGTLVQSSEGEDEAWALDAIEALRSESFVRLQGQRSFELPTMHRKFVARVAEDEFPGLLAEARARIPATSQGRD